MKKVGNAASNKTYNPTNKRPPVPIDADEADTAMERFIRAKYMNNPLASTRRHNTGSTESDETPPPLPPKTFSRFGSSLRSASSLFPLGSKAKKERDAARNTPPASPRDYNSHRNKPSQVFGVSVGHHETGDDNEQKLSQLRDMGFADDHRNAMVLKGVNGNLEKAIEALVRLGEGDGRALSSLTSPRESSVGAARSLTPARSVTMPANRPATASTNPFDMLDMPPPPAQPQSSQSTGTLQNKNPYLSSNPFGMPAQQTQAALDQAFQNMSLAAPSQPLFPHHTGGVPQQANMQQASYQQPPAQLPPAMQQSYGPGVYTSINNQNSQLPVQQTGYNPFFANQQPAQQQPLQMLSVNTATIPGSYANNPFARSPTRIQSPPLTQIPEQAQQNFYNPTLQTAQQPEWYAQPQQPSYQQQQPVPQQIYQQPQPLQPQHTNNPFASPVQYPQPTGQPRPDKASIMALYNYPQLAPQSQQQQQPQKQQQQPQPQVQQQLQQQQPQTAPAQTSSAFDQMFGQPYTRQGSQQQAAPPAPAPANLGPASNNPFMSSGSPSVQTKSNKSRDSMMAFGMEWSNGRHSPDAFASLSARHG